MAISQARGCRTAAVYILFVALIGWSLAGNPTWARSTTTKHAEMAVSGWLADNPTPLGTRPGQDIAGTDTFADERGRNLYHIVYLDPTGWVIVPADDSAEPILAFGATAGDELPTTGPLIALVENDLKDRLESSSTAASATGRLKIQNAQLSAARWRYLMDRAGGSSSGLKLLGQTSISDVRVEPLIQTKWSQSTACGQPCYNYYTPDRYPCGCVATAMAQLLYYYRYPVDGIGRNEFTIQHQGVSRAVTTRGGDGVGGAYQWDSMVLDPNCNTTTSQRRAIGALCYDAGVTVQMDYSAGGSSADAFDIPPALKNVFGFRQAVRGASEDEDGIRAQLVTMLNPNLDAGCPVILGITTNGQDSGHAVVVDGYGYDVGRLTTLYHHVNMGWAGASDLWYNLPEIAGYDTISACIYNIYLADRGEIISGRITDIRNRPLAGVALQAIQRFPVTEATSNDNGIYALVGLPSAASLTIIAEKPGLVLAPQTIQTATSSDWSANTGNRWNVNFTGYVIADYDEDADVDLGDFAVFASTWRHATDDAEPDSTPPAVPADFRNLTDLTGNWLTGSHTTLPESED